MNKKYYFFVVFFLLLFISCGKKIDEKITGKDTNREFSWRDNIQLADIPEFPIKGFLDGKEVNFRYINFERWRGSNDNVINFSIFKPAQKCGFINDFSGFVIVNKGAEISKGAWLKPKFEEDSKSYAAYFFSNGKKSSSLWNCALNIESISDTAVKGRIAISFDDETKSWVAGKFEAVICNN